MTNPDQDTNKPPSQGDESQEKPKTSELEETRKEPKTFHFDMRPDLTGVSKTDTAILRAAPRKAGTPTAPSDTTFFSEKRELILVIRGVVERVVLQEGQRVVLGRSDLRTRTTPDVDLTPYGALDRGVSREHASLHIDGEKLYVTDLNSTNGTFLGGNRLTAFTATALRKGDELLLGRLPVQVLFK
jgi:pSer/pThr/pTyr-binding forkhead associated (FHA) protein